MRRIWSMVESIAYISYSGPLVDLELIRATSHVPLSESTIGSRFSVHPLPMCRISDYTYIVLHEDDFNGVASIQTGSSVVNGLGRSIPQK